MPVFYKIPDHYRGDTFKGVQFSVQVNGSPLPLTGYTLKADFVSGRNTFRMDLTDGLTVIDAANGVFTIDEQVIDWPFGLYEYDIEFSVGGVVKTYIRGEFKILKDITRG